MGRDPIAINSNYYVMDQGVWVPTSIQTARAAGVTSLILLFKKQLESEQLDPLLIRKTIPLCMHQYQRLFGSSRYVFHRLIVGCSKFTEEHPCRSVIPIKLLCNFIEIALRH